MKEALTFDDVLLIPQYSVLGSRKEADTSTRISGMGLTIPVVSSNMDTITEDKMAIRMYQLGGLGILHRYAKTEDVIAWIKNIKESTHHGGFAVPSVGVKKEDLELADRYLDVTRDAICVDIAHGDSEQAIEMVFALKERGWKHIIAGNVATFDGALRLIMAGATTIKVGVGPGSLCTTRIVTGHGVPQLTAIMDCAEVKKSFPEVTIIADGGIRNSGDAVKALAAGADAVMLGGMLAGTDETPGDLEYNFKVEFYNAGYQITPTPAVFINPPQPMVKRYRGMASRDAQVGWRGSVSNDAPEGEAMVVPVKGPVEFVVNELVGGIRSGMSYSGSRTLKEFHKKAQFVKVTSNAVRENGAHGKT